MNPKAPDDIRLALGKIKPIYYCAFQKGDETLMFIFSPDRGDLKIQQPLVSSTPEYGFVQIFADTSQSDAYNLLSRNLYPLEEPSNAITGEKNLSWLVFSYFDTTDE